jgi:glutamate--cysteine ligase
MPAPPGLDRGAARCSREEALSPKSQLSWLADSGCRGLLSHGLRGIEKESLRVSPDGHLAKTPHPAAFGSALTHPYLTTDYSEALLELVTPPYARNWQTLTFLADLHGYVHRGLVGERLWPASMPCIVAANSEIPIARYGSSNAGLMRTVYRRGLGYRYGRAMQAIAGIHFNYSPPESFWPVYRDRLRDSRSLRDFKSEQMMGMVRNYRRHAWLVIYLFGASPAFCKSFRPEGHELLHEWDAATWYAPHATSLRMSDMGYRNKTQARLNISANSLGAYVEGLRSALATPDPRYQSIGVKVDGEYRQLNANILQIENEYYSTIRPKPKAGPRRTTALLEENGVDYVEVRTLDLNVGDPAGIGQQQMRFLESFLIASLLTESPPIGDDEQQEIDARDLLVARAGRQPGLELSIGGRRRAMVDWGMRWLDAVEAAAESIDVDGEGYVAAVEEARRALGEPELTPSARLLAELEETGMSFSELGLATALEHQRYFLSLPIDAEKQAFLDAAMERSKAEARALEAADEPSFDDYLRGYLASA